jgi:hypothetical protein
LVQSTLLARYWISSSEARRIRKGRTWSGRRWGKILGHTEKT